MPASTAARRGPARFPDQLPRGPKLWTPRGSGWTRENTDGIDTCELIEAHQRLTKGRNRGQLVQLRHWQGDLICDVLRLDETGYRQHRTYELWIPRKNGKSLVCAGLALDGLFDEPGAEVYSCAGDKDQARIVFAFVKATVEEDEELSGLLNVYKDVIEYPDLGSVYRVLSAEAFSKEGLDPSRVIFDELHVQPDDELWNVMNQGSDTREQPLVVSISTFGKMYDNKGRETIAFREYQRCKRVLSGEDDDESFGCRIYETSSIPGRPAVDVDERDPTVWEESNPALGDYLSPANMMATCRKIRRAEFCTKRLNIWMPSDDGSDWLPDGMWERLADSEREIEAGEKVVISFDGSYNGDCSAILGCTVEKQPHLFVIDVWERPEDADESWRVPRSAVRTRVRDWMELRGLDVVELAPDPPGWHQEIEEWEETYGDVVVRFETYKPSLMAPACSRFYTAVTNDEPGLSHDGNPVLARHLRNAKTKETPDGAYITKEYRSSPKKIDAAVAAVIALARASWHAGIGGDPLELLF